MENIIQTIIFKITVLGTVFLTLITGGFFGLSAVEPPITKDAGFEDIAGVPINAVSPTTSPSNDETPTKTVGDKQEIPADKTEAATPERRPPQETTGTELAIAPQDKLPEPEEETEQEQPRPALLDISTVNEEARAALVNIFCVTAGGGPLLPLTASGVIINPSGIVITNAHVAQYFLLKDTPLPDSIRCVLRTGSPAKPVYEAKLVYLPSTWVSLNAEKIAARDPYSTGEHDYAFLLITNPVKKTDVLPDTFPFIIPRIAYDTVLKNMPTLVASYPAGFIDGISATKNLWAVTSTDRIENIFTFRTEPPYTPDVISLPGTIGTQEGSSGGAVVSLEDGSMVGLIFARTSGNTTGERTLRALSFFHINDSLRAHLGISLAEFLSSDISQIGKEFRAVVAPELTKILEEALGY